MIDPGEIVNAVIEALAAATGRPVGDGKAPPDRSLPYHVVRTIPGGSTDGSMGDPNADLELPIQIDTVAGTRDGADHGATRARSVILGRLNGTWAVPLEGEGWRVYFREHDGYGGADGEGEVYLAPERYRLHVTPAPVQP